MPELKRIEGWQHPIAFYRADGGEIEEWSPPFLFLPVKLSLLPYIRGAINYWSEGRKWEGTPEEIEQATQSALEQELTDVLTVQQVAALWGATFRILDTATMEASQEEYQIPPPWEFMLQDYPGGALLMFRSLQLEGE